MPAHINVSNERTQHHVTRRQLFIDLENLLKRPVISFFTSFHYPVMLTDDDAEALEAIIQKTDLGRGLALIISSPGGDGLAAERIINICRCHSGTGEYWTIVPGKAKSAATLVCFGASKIIMGSSSELGPVDPQWIVSDNGSRRQFSLHNVVKSYEDLFEKAAKHEGNLEPYLQQLANYDSREIEEFRRLIELADDISIRTLKSGMMRRHSEPAIRKKIEGFLTPAKAKSHGRPIFRDEAATCGLKVKNEDKGGRVWGLVYELYVRSNQYVSRQACKCVESKDFAFYVPGDGE
jgi:hypothetical protein